MAHEPILTTVVGSYPFPGWLEYGSQHTVDFGPADIDEMRDDATTMAIMDQVFQRTDVQWRGLGTIPKSGLAIRETYARFDAARVFDLCLEPSPEPKGCACGEILTGTKIPPQCPLFRNGCDPMQPVGPCMVSSEGTCAAYYRYDTTE